MVEFGLLKEGLKYVPSLIGAIVIVLLFLRYLNSRDERDMKKEVMLQEDFNKRDEVLKVISSRGFEIHQESNAIIKENTAIIGEVKHALDLVLRDK